MMKRRGFSEKTMYIYNPMPQIDPEELKTAIDKAHPKILEAQLWPTGDPFQINLKFGGPPAETIFLKAGDHVAVRENEINEIYTRNAREQGLVVLDSMDREEVLKKSLAGLEAARKFYMDRGERRLQDIRRGQGIGREEMQERAYDHWSYYWNQARGEAVAAFMLKLRSGGRRTKANDTAEDAA